MATRGAVLAAVLVCCVAWTVASATSAHADGPLGGTASPAGIDPVTSVLEDPAPTIGATELDQAIDGSTLADRVGDATSDNSAPAPGDPLQPVLAPVGSGVEELAQDLTPAIPTLPDDSSPALPLLPPPGGLLPVILQAGDVLIALAPDNDPRAGAPVGPDTMPPDTRSGQPGGDSALPVSSSSLFAPGSNHAGSLAVEPVPSSDAGAHSASLDAASPAGSPAQAAQPPAGGEVSAPAGPWAPLAACLAALAAALAVSRWRGLVPPSPGMLRPLALGPPVPPG